MSDQLGFLSDFSITSVAVGGSLSTVLLGVQNQRNVHTLDTGIVFLQDVCLDGYSDQIDIQRLNHNINTGSGSTWDGRPVSLILFSIEEVEAGGVFRITIFADDLFGKICWGVVVLTNFVPTMVYWQWVELRSIQEPGPKSQQWGTISLNPF